MSMLMLMVQVYYRMKKKKKKTRSNICCGTMWLLVFVPYFILLLFAVRRWSVYKLISFRSGTYRRVPIKFVPSSPFNILCGDFSSLRSHFYIGSNEHILFPHWCVSFCICSLSIANTKWELLILDFGGCSTFYDMYIPDSWSFVLVLFSVKIRQDAKHHDSRHRINFHLDLPIRNRATSQSIQHFRVVFTWIK